MYKGRQPTETCIRCNESMVGEILEQKLRRILDSGEPISDGGNMPIIHTERKDGVLPEYDIRTDKWDIALDGMDKVHKAKEAQRERKARPSIENPDKTEQKTGGEGSAEQSQ